MAVDGKQSKEQPKQRLNAPVGNLRAPRRLPDQAYYRAKW